MHLLHSESLHSSSRIKTHTHVQIITTESVTRPRDCYKLDVRGKLRAGIMVEGVSRALRDKEKAGLRTEGTA